MPRIGVAKGALLGWTGLRRNVYHSFGLERTHLMRCDESGFFVSNALRGFINIFEKIGGEYQPQARIAVLFGMSRRIGPVLSANVVSVSLLKNVFALLGRNCTCTSDPAWLLGPAAPLVWGQDGERTADADSTQLTFPPPVGPGYIKFSIEPGTGEEEAANWYARQRCTHFALTARRLAVRSALGSPRITNRSVPARTACR